MEAIALPFLLLVGSLLAVQAAANVQLSAAMTSPFGASALQLGHRRWAADRARGGGWVARRVRAARRRGAVDARRRPRQRDLHHRGDPALPPRRRAGGGRAVHRRPDAGVAAARRVRLAGRRAGAARRVGAARRGAVVAGAWLIVRAQAGARSLERVARRWIALGLVAGAALPVQGAINARLRAELDAPIAVGAFSFVVATVAMSLVLAAALALGRSAAPAGRAAPPGAVVGLARRAVRGDVRDVRLPPHPGDRRRADDRAHRRGPAGRVGPRRPLRPPPPPAPPDPAPPPPGRDDPARRSRAHPTPLKRV